MIFRVGCGPSMHPIGFFENLKIFFFRVKQDGNAAFSCYNDAGSLYGVAHPFSRAAAPEPPQGEFLPLTPPGNDAAA